MILITITAMVMTGSLVLFLYYAILWAFCDVFRLDALALSVILQRRGWLGGWVAGWLSHSGTVSRRLNLSENFFDHLKAPSF